MFSSCSSSASRRLSASTIRYSSCRRIRNRHVLLSSEYINTRHRGIQGTSRLLGSVARLDSLVVDSNNHNSPTATNEDDRPKSLQLLMMPQCQRLYSCKRILQSAFHQHVAVCSFHSTATSQDEEKPMSAKEKKKLLKQKAKAAAAAAAAAEEKEEGGGDDDPAEARKEALKAKLKAKNKEDSDGSDSSPSDTATKEKSESTPKEEMKEESSSSSSSSSSAPSSEDEPSSAAPEDEQSSSEPKQYSYPELTEDAQRHKAGLEDPDRPSWQNPLHHNNPDMHKVFREDFDSDEEFEAAVVPAPPLSIDDGESVAAPAYIQEIAEEILLLNMLEMNELTNKIADHYGFHEGMLSPDDVLEGGGGFDDGGLDEGADGADAAAAEKTSFDIKLVSYEAKAKIKVIKEVRSVAGLGLKEAKEMVEGAPVVVIKEMKKEEADEIKSKLEELGATIEIV